MIFLVDFYVLDMTDDSYTKSMSLLLEVTFMKIAHTKKDMHSMEIINFNNFEEMKYPDNGGDDFEWELNKSQGWS